MPGKQTICIRQEKEREEQKRLSPFAARSQESRGRKKKEAECQTRTIYERDVGRIIYTREFRRLRHKTQVFFNPRSDHVCTRMEHVIYVSYIARTIGGSLKLNRDLIEAIALGHDIGHAPFGHSGEAELNAILKREQSDLVFQHEAHSLRVLDILAERDGKPRGLNLSFEVRDGIASHCGEKYLETRLVPQPMKSEENMLQGIKTHAFPATLEGCVVRIADRIAYLGRDIEDAARAGLMDFTDIPGDIKKSLGKSNGEIVNSLVTDIISESRGKNEISLSREKAESMSRLLQINSLQIYQADKVRRYEFLVRQIIDGLYQAYKAALEDPERLAAAEDSVLQSFARYVAAHPEPQATNQRKIIDYIAGMTDAFATESFNQLYQI